MPAQITVAYHDFYPNRLVLERIARQWEERLGVRTELAERDYADPSQVGIDASFVLRYPAFNHPYAFFDQCESVAPDPVLRDLLCGFAAGEPESGNAVVSHLRATAPVLRLFEVVGHWLAHPRVTGFRWPSDAVFDFTALRCSDESPS